VADPASRSAARWAAVVAVPVALVAGLVAYRVLSRPAHPAPAATSPAAQSPAAQSPAAQSPAPVPMPAPPLSPRDATVCRALVLSHLPTMVRDRARRPVTAGADQNAAYGDPPITLACGEPTASVPPTATVFNLSGVCWYPDQGASVTTWTTVDRETPVTVTVPNSYDAQAQWVIGFSAPVAGSIGPVSTAPSGCKG
jgi:hypothetical protein